MSAAVKFEAGQIYVHAADLPAPVPFELAPEVRQWRDEIKAIDDAAHPAPVPPVEPFGQRLRLRQIYEQDLARACAAAYDRGYRSGVAGSWSYRDCAHLVSAALGAAAMAACSWAYDLVRGWL